MPSLPRIPICSKLPAVAIMFACQLVADGEAAALERLELGDSPAGVHDLREEAVAAHARAFRFDCEREPPGEWLGEIASAHQGLRLSLEFVDEYGETASRAVWSEGRFVEQEHVAPQSLAWVEWLDLED